MIDVLGYVGIIGGFTGFIAACVIGVYFMFYATKH